MVWLGAAALLLVRKITVYQGFVKYMKAGWEEVTDMRMLEALAQMEEYVGVKRPVELYRHTLPSVMLSAGAKQLKERLGVIMNYKKSSKATIVVSVVLTVLLTAGAATAGVAVPSETKAAGIPASSVTGVSGRNNSNTSSLDSSAEKYYKADNLPAFGRVFSRMEQDMQKVWLDRIYKDGDIAFFSVSLRQLEAGSDFVEFYAKKAYKDDKISFFSVLTGYMDRKTQKAWLKKAEKDKRTAFRMELMEKLDMDDELRQLRQGLDQERIAEYKKYGITVKGDSYYYKGKLVYFFLDSQKGSSAYTVGMDPEGTVSVKVTRGTDGIIKSVRRMSDEEVEKLLSPGDGWKNLEKEEQETEGQDYADAGDEALTKAGGVKVTVPVHIDQLKDGKFAWLGTYELAENDTIYYRVTAKAGERLDVGFAKPGSGDPDVTYHTVSNRRTDGKLQVKAGGFIWKKPLKPGSYRLFIHTRGGDLKNVEGAVVIVRSEV